MLSEFRPRWHYPAGCSILVDQQHWMPGYRRSTVVRKVRLVGWHWQSEVSVDMGSHWWEFCKIYKVVAVGDTDEMIRFWGQRSRYWRGHMWSKMALWQFCRSCIQMSQSQTVFLVKAYQLTVCCRDRLVWYSVPSTDFTSVSLSGHTVPEYGSCVSDWELLFHIFYWWIF